MMDIGTATIALAASVCDRTHDLIQDGWVQGRMSGGWKGVQTFCILGAIDMALAELFPDKNERAASKEIGDVVRTFILDEALAQFKYRGGSIPGFNDPKERGREHVLTVLDKAARRLWDLSVEQKELRDETSWTPSQWAEVDPALAEQYQSQYLNAVLA